MLVFGKYGNHGITSLHAIAQNTGLGSGIFPTADPFGTPFSEQYMPDRAKLGGTPIADGLCGILDGYQMDLEFVKKTFYLTRSLNALSSTSPQHIQAMILNLYMCCIQGDYTRKQMCFLCQAWPCKGRCLNKKTLIPEALHWVYAGRDPDGASNDAELLFTNFGRSALHRSTLAV